MLLLPVLLDDCEIPELISTRRYYDLRDPRNLADVVQTLVNQILGMKPFSQRVRDFLSQTDPRSPYDRHSQTNGRTLLKELAKYREMELNRTRNGFCGSCSINCWKNTHAPCAWEFARGHLRMISIHSFWRTNGTTRQTQLLLQLMSSPRGCGGQR